MNLLMIYCLRIMWTFTLAIDLAGGFFGLSSKVSIFLPAVYLGLSFVIFNKLHIGYRVFHHICVVPLILYYTLGLFLNGRGVFSSSSVESFISYSWFSSLSVAYLIFCLMFLIAYAPYLIFRKFRGLKNAK